MRILDTFQKLGDFYRLDVPERQTLTQQRTQFIQLNCCNFDTCQFLKCGIYIIRFFFCNLQPIQLVELSAGFLCQFYDHLDISLVASIVWVKIYSMSMYACSATRDNGEVPTSARSCVRLC